MTVEVIALVISGLCWTLIGQHLRIRELRAERDLQTRVITELLSAPSSDASSDRRAS